MVAKHRNQFGYTISRASIDELLQWKNKPAAAGFKCDRLIAFLPPKERRPRYSKMSFYHCWPSYRPCPITWSAERGLGDRRWRYRFETLQSWIKSGLCLCHYMANKNTSKVIKLILDRWQGSLNSLSLNTD